LFKRIFINNLIRAREVRLIDKDGKQLGVLRLEDALRKAREAGLDLIQVTQKISPPVCKIGDYGKYAYQVKKKERKQKQQKSGELKSIRLRFNISPHDMETRVKAAEKFFKKGYKHFARQKMVQFLEILQKSTTIKIEREIKREARGLTMMISQSQNHEDKKIN